MKSVEFHRKKLDNGLTVLFEKRKMPVVTTASSVKYGAQYETADVKGISHFIEHLVFKGTKKRKVDEIPKEIESKGGMINAFTGEEITGFWNKLPKKHFSLGADVVRDLVLNPKFNKSALERERRVILEEIKMYHDNPSSYIIEKIKELLYRKPFGSSIAGTAETVKDLSRKRIMDLFNSIYSTNNMIFSVVGNCSWEEVLREARRFPKTNREINQVPIVSKNGESIEKRKGIDQAHEVLGFHVPKLTDKNRYAMEIFNSVLGGGMSSRLFQEIREKRGLCYTIKTHLEQSRDYGYNMIYAGTTKDKIRDVKKLALREIKRLGKLKQRELNEEKEKLIGSRQIEKEKSENVMLELLKEEIGGDAGEYYNYEDRINEVKLKEVRKLSKLKGYSFAGLVPEK